MSAKKLINIEVSREIELPDECKNGFLKLKRYKLKNVYENNEKSREYTCDIVYRKQVDAVGILLYFYENNSVKILLRRCLRPPLFFRKNFVKYDFENENNFFVYEIPAGIIEEGETKEEDIDKRAEIEVLEETGIKINKENLINLGKPILTSPGFTIEKVFIKAIRIDKKDFDNREHVTGDGSLMEEGGELHIFTIEEALEMCYNGEIGDSKTEIALYRLKKFLKQF